MRLSAVYCLFGAVYCLFGAAVQMAYIMAVSSVGCCPAIQPPQPWMYCLAVHLPELSHRRPMWQCVRQGMRSVIHLQ